MKTKNLYALLSLSIIGGCILTSCNKQKSSVSTLNSEKKQGIIGLWIAKGSSMARLAGHPDAKEISPGIYALDNGVSYSFEVNGKFVRKNENIASMGGKGTWKFSESKLSLAYDSDDYNDNIKVEFNTNFPDENHMIITDSTGMMKEYYEKR